MAQYRIKEHIYRSRRSYEIQKKSIFGFWYNPDNIDGCTTGVFDTLKKAEECIKNKLFIPKHRIIQIK